MDRNLLVDYAKVAMALMVVAIHTRLFSDVTGPLHHLLDEGLFRIAVPIFFVFNGYYLGLAMHNRQAAGKAIRRIVLLYAIWMLVYAPFYVRPEGNLKDLAKLLLFGYYQLWYLIAMVYAVVMLWFARKWRVPLLIVTGLGLFGACVVLQYLNSYTDINLAVWKYRNGALFGFPFLLAGYLLRTHGERVSTRAAWWALALGLCGLLIESLLAYRYARANLGMDLYASLMLVAPAAALLLLRTSRQIRTDRAAKLSTHLYVIHPLMIAASIHVLQLPRNGSLLFMATVVLSLLAFVPIYALSKKIRFIL